MKIVLATPLYPPEIGGPATYAKLLADMLPKKGIEVVLVKFSDVRHLPKLIRHYRFFQIVRYEAKSADLVIALDPVSVGVPALFAARAAKKKFVIKIVGDYAWEQGQQRFGVTKPLDIFIHSHSLSLPVALLRVVQTWVARQATRIIVPSNYLKRVVMAWGIDEPHVSVIYNAVELEDLGNVPKEVVALPRPLVATVGRLVPWKHIGALIEALAHTSDISLAIVGDGPERIALERHARLLPNRVVFTGALSHRDTLAVMKSADLFVLNSSYEGLSHLLIEALSLGTPSIATRVGGNSEVVTDEESGLLIPVGDIPALANAIARAIGDTELRERLTQSAEATAKRFSASVMIDATAALITSL